jgi:hypothetical protein
VAVTLAVFATLGAAPGASAETLGGGTNARTIEIAPGSPSLPSPGAPDPSSIAVSGLTGPVSGVSVLLREVSDPNAEGLAVLLVGPSGHGVVLMASYEAGRHRALRNVGLSFSDSGQTVGCPEPEGSTLTPGAKLAPFDCGLVSPFSFPAPSGPYASQLKELGSNGTWSLYVENTTENEAFIAGGWILSVSTEAEGLPLPVNPINQYKPEGFTPAEFAEFEARQEQMRVEYQREAQQRAREAQEQAARAAATSTTAKPVCIVPSLLGHGLADARRLLGVAHCRLGHVTTSRGHRGALVIGAQHPRRGTRMALGSSVSVTLKVRRR